MAPVCKVLLIDDIEFEEEDDVHSGPHSMLFGIKEGTYIKDFQRIDQNATFINIESDSSSEENDTKKLIRSETYERLNKIQPNTTTTKNLARTSTYDISEGIAHTNSTFKIIDASEKSSGIENLTYLNGNNFPDIVNSTRIFNDVEQSIDDRECVDDNNTTLVLNKTISRDLQNTTAVLEHSFNELDYPSPIPIVNPTSSAELNNSTPICYVGNKIKKPYNLVEIDRKGTLQRTKPKNESQLNDSNKCLNDTLTLNSKLKLTKLLTVDSSPMPNETQLAHPTSLFADSDVENSPRRRRVKISSSAFAPGNEDDSTKRDSLEFEESLGILTPEQMTDLTGFSESRTSSPENIGSLPHDFQSFVNKFQTELKVSELPSPNLVDTSVRDVSLGIIDENMLLSLAIKSETTVNMELRFDSVGKGKSYTITRLEQTPSPEDLPLDPTPIIECESKIEPIKSKTASSFITSITSITSLDTGYQGDGEMSRPASRGADHSPLTRRPTQRPQPRRPDPLTDSDFYTESDADNHEEHPLRGGRLARVIDGTLYGVDPQAAADIYVNNRENMDSSGIFTDIEGNTRTDELSSAENENQDISPSPSDTSSKTISNNSQNNAPGILNKTMNKTGSIVKHNNNNNNNNSISEKKELIIDEMPLKRKSPTPSSTASSPASVRSPRHTPRESNSASKYKMPKRNVTSKVKAALETNNQQRKEVNSITPKKTVGRWDAVMNKISKNTSSLKEIKSKVFTNNSSNTSTRQATTPNNKLRRGRTRSDMTITKTNAESLHSSASDLSTAAPAKRIGSGKKRAEVVRVTQVLTATKLSPRTVHKNNGLSESKKNVPKPIADVKSPPRKTLFSPKEKKLTPTPTNKDCVRGTVKGGRASPGARPPQQTRVPTVPISRTTEALAVLVQHLVFNLEAFQTPSLQKQVERSRILAEEARLSCKQIEENIKQIRFEHAKAIEDEREKYRQDFDKIIEQHRSDILQLNSQRIETEKQLLLQQETFKKELSIAHNEQVLKLKCDLQKNHEQSLDILREENDSIREEIDEKSSRIKLLQTEYRLKESQYKEKINSLNEELDKYKAENFKLMNLSSEGKENKVQSVFAEVESLRAVLDLKQNQLGELRKLLAEANQKAELLPSTAEKVSLLTARCEDLECQLESKCLYEQQLLGENKKLQESLKEELNQTIRIRHHNEELQWKLQQNKEVVSRVIEETAFNRYLINSTYNENNSASRQLERTSSFRERSLSNKSYNSADGSLRNRKSKNSCDLDFEELSPPSSPKVKGVVEKSDSVSYVLEMEESPEMIANRIVRRSFRNSTPPKTTPTKSPVNKKPRMKSSPLSLSASASAIVPNLNGRNDYSRSRSVSVRNDDTTSSGSNADEVFMWHLATTSTPNSKKYANGQSCESSYCAELNFKYEDNIDLRDFNDEDIHLPALPSELGRNNMTQSLPVPKHLAGEAMVSESNSEDESTTSSSSSHL